MSKVVIPRATEFGAGCVVVMVITHHADSVYEAGCWTVVGDGVPVLTGQNDARVGSPLDQLTTISHCILVPGFQNKGIGPRPSKVKR